MSDLKGGTAASLTRKQEMVYKVFISLMMKQELGKVGAKEVEQFMTIAEQAAIKLLAIK